MLKFHAVVRIHYGLPSQGAYAAIESTDADYVLVIIVQIEIELVWRRVCVFRCYILEGFESWFASQTPISSVAFCVIGAG